ncbi:hypothetical protein SLNWT_0791 [Streptomyces albus]|uniref:SCO6045-like C-terminal domain-containing protein n=1 Tax=Streptomyces albus (strain ATCC 21838 / DSM 41398 / FERM P-419 / JCM 4703 / NBRC 107858) TaxID=1081613 RepID=A0A0B5ESQ2_STRA4|nr:hypothetical protein SLNWT_0791 [Streptomyces albus]AOU75481.1 hypothetical protein SLNHY_0790 [Streptomyces albus]AYN31284.1 DUF692 domain-containing protein [Streptomyces albus]
MERLGTGIGWRPEIAEAVEAMPGIDWVEAVAENLCPGHLPPSLARLRERGVTLVPHGVGLGLGGAERPDEERLAALAARAESLGSPLVTEHIAFVRAGGARTVSPPLEAGHLLPVPRTREALDVLCENVRIAQAQLPVPLAVENIAALFSWPDEELTEGQFLYELADRTGVRLLIDVANLHTNHVNRGEDPAEALDALPLEALAYVHVAGGFERDGVWHDSHAHPVPPAVLDVLAALAARVTPPGVLLERDENFPEPAALERELADITRTVREAGAPGARATADTSAAPREATAATGKGIGTGKGIRPTTTAEAVTGTSAAVREPTAASGKGIGTRLTTAQAVAGTSAAGRVPTAVSSNGIGTGAGTRPLTPEAAARPTTPAAAAQPTTSESSEPTARPADFGTAAPPEASTTSIPAPPATPSPVPEAARQRLALAQTALLSALVAGTPAPEGFDRNRLTVQSRALAAKRADVVAKVAPELPVILGAGYRAAFLGYAQARPMTGGYRRDALDFAEHLLLAGGPEEGTARGELRDWWLEREGPRPRSARPLARLRRAARSVLAGR